MKITEIKAEKKETKVQRLAAYCRVSSNSEDQLHSFAAQLRYYTNYEKQHPDVKLVGIYADEGLSGTSMKKRAEMNRMIQDCEQGKIDRVITKSVSRFARNTHDLLKTLRLLKSYGVTVFFEEQGIDTSQLNSEMFLTFPGMIAQQESESISGNMRWSYKKRMESGEFNCCTPAYGFNLVDGELIINEDEAKIVRRIFDMYLKGIGKQRIADILNEESVPKKYGEKKWHHSMISYILSNERYIGDALLQKNYTTDTLPFRKLPNRGEKPQYYVENSHPAIIDKNVFESAQNFSKKRRSSRKGNADHILTQMLFCPKCGKAFRKIINSGKPYWIMSVAEKSNCDCQYNRLRESGVFDAFSLLTFKLKENRDQIIGKLITQLEQLQTRSGNCENAIGDIDKKIAQLSAQNHVLAKLKNNGILGSAEYAGQSADIENKIASLRTERRKKLSQSKDDEILDELKTLNQIIGEYQPSAVFDKTLFDVIVKRIEVTDNVTITFKLLGDIELSEKISEKARCKQREQKDNPIRV